jgi:hypothetical protein
MILYILMYANTEHSKIVAGIRNKIEIKLRKGEKDDLEIKKAT